jgi:hypothetical protein
MLRYSFGVGVQNIRPQLLNYDDPTVKATEIGFFSTLALSNLNEMLRFCTLPYFSDLPGVVPIYYVKDTDNRPLM